MSSKRLFAVGIIALTATLIQGCGDDAPAPPEPDGAVDAQPTPVVTASAVPEVFIDLAASAERAHIRRRGPIYRPGGPGWDRVTRIADRGPWRGVRAVDGRQAAWLDGIGGTLSFPVGPEGESLRWVSVWLRPSDRDQVVSVFLDEQLVVTTKLFFGWKRYVWRLPIDGFGAGEHTLRFWFRFTRPYAGMNTPAAFGDVQFLAAGEQPDSPLEFTAPDAEGRRRRLIAGPPFGWTHYLLPSAESRLFVTARTESGPPVDFVIRVAHDGQPIEEARRISLAAGESRDIDLSLDSYAGRPIRVSFDTEGKSGDFERARWEAPSILRPSRHRARTPKVKNVILWAVDGLRGDRLGLGRGGERAETPNIDLLAREGGVALKVWSAGASATDGHRRLLTPQPGAPSLPAQMASVGLTSGLLSASGALESDMTADFATRLNLRRAGEPVDTRTLLREVDGWLTTQKSQPFFLYLVSDDPRVPLRPARAFQRLYERERPLPTDVTRRVRRSRDLFVAYDARLSITDYWVGQLVATLERHSILEDTAIIITGSVGQELRERGGLGDGHALVPQVFRVPLLVWHPGLRNTGQARAFVEGTDLADVAATAVHLVGGQADATWPGVDLSPALFHGVPLPSKPTHARFGTQYAARYGLWLLRASGLSEVRLWHFLDEEETISDPTLSHPIAVRTLRDSMQDDR